MSLPTNNNGHDKGVRLRGYRDVDVCIERLGYRHNFIYLLLTNPKTHIAELDVSYALVFRSVLLACRD